MARIWQNGFETNMYPAETKSAATIDNYAITIGQYDKYCYGSFKIAPGSTRGGIGDKCIEFRAYNNGSVTSSKCYAYSNSTLDEDEEEIYFRTYFKVVSSNVSSANTFFVSDNANKQLLKVTSVRLSSTEYSLGFYNHAGTLMYDFKTLIYGEWIKLDFRLKIGVENGKFQLKINDRLITTWDGNTQGSNGLIRNIKFGCYDNHGGQTAKTTIMSFDDMAINDTSGSVNNAWCGNGSIVNLYPYANGSINQFTPLEGTQNFENVDEENPDGDTTYNSSYSLEDTDLFKFKAPETINGDKVINAISIYSQGKYLEKPLNFAHVVKTLDQEIENCNSRLSNGYTQQWSIIQVNPNTNSKYTVDEFNNDLEIGYRTKDYE